MGHSWGVAAAGFLALAVVCVLPGSSAERRLRLDAIKLPSGFRIGVYANNVPGARSMALSPNGTVFVGTRGEGVVYALSAPSGAERALKVRIVARGLDAPNGVAFRDRALYVAEVSRILRYEDIEARLDHPPAPVVVSDAYPRNRVHGWKFIAFGPDGMLYVPVGAPCNVCEPSGRNYYETIVRMRPDGGKPELFARGVRNSVGFDWDPETRELWFTENGRDWLGDDRPPDELNHAPRPGLHFGFPYCHGRGIPDPEFGAAHSCTQFTPPAMELGPHVAALGMRFYTGTMFPADYRHQIFIAEHGSWNRSRPIGYRVMLVRLEQGRAVRYDVFAEGWLPNGREAPRRPFSCRSRILSRLLPGNRCSAPAWGRPVDVLVMPDGALLVSDDQAGAIYRITYSRSERLSREHRSPADPR